MTTESVNALRQIFPNSIESIDIETAFAINVSDAVKKFLRLNMVTSIDGAISLSGTARGLSSDIDRKVFHILRSLSDVILVGAGTMRTEKYGPVSLTKKEIINRRESKQISIPPIAVISNSGTFNFETDFFTKAITKPILLTTEIGSKSALKANSLADIYVCGKVEVDLNIAVDTLVKLGHKNILCEGGPSLNTSLLNEDLIDELCLTITPKIVGGNGKRLFDGLNIDIPIGFEYRNIFLEQEQLFFRLTKARSQV